MHAVIIGIDGGMGQWMKKHLTGLGYTVYGFDERRGDHPSALKDADLVVVSVPIPATAETIRNAIKNMKKDAVLMEIASIKSGIHEAMIEAAGLGFSVLCVHPMFGPSTESLEGKTVAVIPVLNRGHEHEEALRFFPGVSIEVVEAEEHDRLMSIVLSLSYLVNLTFAATVKDEDLILLRKLSGSTFAIQYILAQSVVGENTSLIEGVISRNPYLIEISESFLENFNMIACSAGTAEFKALHNGIKDSMKKDSISQKAQGLRQSTFDLMTRKNSFTTS